MITQLPTTIPGVVLVELAAHEDARGRFMETFHRDRYTSAGVAVDLAFVQDNASSSVAGTLRGLHYQLAQPQGKLVHVTRGEIFDVAVDIRLGSPTFGRWFAAVLSEANRRQLWVPPGFAHGFYAVTDADVTYKCTAYYAPAEERAIRWDDPELAIDWPLRGSPRLSSRDAAAPSLAAADLPRFEA